MVGLQELPGAAGYKRGQLGDQPGNAPGQPGLCSWRVLSVPMARSKVTPERAKPELGCQGPEPVRGMESAPS